MLLELESSRLSREIINLFIGMSFGAPDLPRLLIDGGYLCHSIEQTFPVGVNDSVNPEVIFCSIQEAHTLIVECKSGANLKPDQLARYAMIANTPLALAAQVPPDAATSYELLIVGKQEHAERLLLGSGTVEDPRRIIAVRTDGGINRIEGEFTPAILNARFNMQLSVNWDVVPQHYFPVDVESQDWQFAEYIMPELIAAILRGDTEIPIDYLMKSLILQWDFISPSYKKKLRQRVLLIVRRAASRRFNGYMTVSPHKNQNAVIAIVEEAEQPGTISRRQSRLNNSLQRFMDDLSSPQLELELRDEPTQQSQI
jgi:hypothetical protein